MFLAIGIILIIVAGFLIFIGHSDDSKKVKVSGYAGVLIAIVLVVIHFNTAQGARALKDFTSNTTGGLERSVQVYDQSGKVIKEYSGKIDVKDTEYGNKVLFDLDGKRTIIYNGTVIVQEK